MTLPLLTLLLPLRTFIGCSSNNTTSHHADHTDHADHNGHGHHEEEAEQVTVWTDSIEAFVEFEPLKLNQSSRMLVHLTWLNGHQPVTEGNLTVHLEGDGVHDQVSVSEPARRGIFIPSLKPSSTKGRSLWLELNSAGRSERIDLAEVNIIDPSHGHDHGHGHHEEEAEASNANSISFLKEQAWDIPFQTDPVLEKPLYQTIEALGQWTARPEDWFTIVAPANGTVVFGSSIPYLGAELKPKEPIFTIQTDHLSEDSLSLRWQEVQLQWRTVQSEYERNKPLKDDGILSQSQWNAIESRYLSVKTQYDRLSSQTQNGRAVVVNPILGRVAEVYVSAGQYVEQGTPLYKLVTQSPSLLQLSIPHRHHDALKHIQQVEVQIDGTWTQLEATTTVGLSLGEHHTIPIQVLTTPQEHVFAEEKTPVRLVFGSPSNQLVIPTSSLLEEYGQYAVIRQLGGEEFALQSVKIGDRNGDSVSIISGLNLGDWVVSEGGYTVKMVSESGNLPAHGHAH